MACYKEESFRKGGCKTIQTLWYLPKYLFEIIDPVIQRNALFSQPENMLLVMAMKEPMRDVKI